MKITGICYLLSSLPSMPEKLQVPENPASLKALVESYNDLAADNHIERLFYLQKICNQVFNANPSNDMSNWRNQLGRSGLESHLQFYGVHRDSSILLQSIEFATAIKRYAPLGAQPTQTVSIHTAMRSRNETLKDPPSADNLRNYISFNLAIMDFYEASQALQERVARHQHFLALSYAKVDAIQGFVQQSFDEYQTKVLGSGAGNNKNFFFDIANSKNDSEHERVVIRVEDRNSLGKEADLQLHSVSNYFSEDYVTFMMPFEEDGEVNYQPVVISQLAKEADLSSYSEKFAKQKNNEPVVAQQAQHFFTQLNDFCLKLMESGHYHPDIKLSNFLTDGRRIIVSDRKTLVDNPNPLVADIQSSPLYAAPEFNAHVSPRFGYKASAKLNNISMPEYMSYQLGMALKEFLCQGLGKEITVEEFQAWLPVTAGMAVTDDQVKNLSVLVQELTRANPSDRLPVDKFQELLIKTNLPAQQFLQEVNKTWPAKNLSTYNELTTLMTVLLSENITPEMEEQITPEVLSLINDPRIDIVEDNFQKYAERKIKNYVTLAEKTLLKNDLQQASFFRKVLHYMTGGLIRVPRVNPIDSLSHLNLDPIAQKYLEIAMANDELNLDFLNRKGQRLFNKILNGNSADNNSENSVTAAERTEKAKSTIAYNTLMEMSTTVENDAANDNEIFSTVDYKDTTSIKISETLPASTVIRKSASEAKPKMDDDIPPDSTMIRKNTNKAKPQMEDDIPSDSTMIRKSTNEAKPKMNDDLSDSTVAYKSTSEIEPLLKKGSAQKAPTSEKSDNKSGVADIKSAIERGNKLTPVKEPTAAAQQHFKSIKEQLTAVIQESETTRLLDMEDTQTTSIKSTFR